MLEASAFEEPSSKKKENDSKGEKKLSLPPLFPSLEESLFGDEEKDSLKIGRNTPCPCGSGKKFKSCCGKYTQEA